MTREPTTGQFQYLVCYPFASAGKGGNVAESYPRELTGAGPSHWAAQIRLSHDFGCPESLPDSTNRPLGLSSATVPIPEMRDRPWHKRAGIGRVVAVLTAASARGTHPSSQSTDPFKQSANDTSRCRVRPVQRPCESSEPWGRILSCPNPHSPTILPHTAAHPMSSQYTLRPETQHHGSGPEPAREAER